jgi:carbamoyl-phosphate synthase large subunit
MITKKQINILFLGGAKRVSLAEKFIAEGKEKGINVSIFSYELEDNVPISFVATIVIGLKWKDSNLYSHLQEIIKKKNIHIVIPFLDYATIIAARLKSKIDNKKVFFPVSDEPLCDMFFNKQTSNDWCEANDVNIPNNITQYPLIAKPVTGSASQGILKLETPLELEQLSSKENYLIQQFIIGKEYSVDIYVSPVTQQIISIVPRERMETQGGESIKSITIKEQRFIEFSREIIEKSGLVGPITLQFLEDNNTKELFFMEINPRFGGAVLNSIFSGANTPCFILNDFLKIENTYTEDWKDAYMMIRRFSEYYKICK